MKLFSCLRRKKAPTKIAHPKNEVSTVGPANNIPIALVVGHNKKAQGAVNYLGETEYVFNKRIAAKIQEKLTVIGVPSAVIERPSGSYSYQCKTVANRIKELECRFSLHLHFNSYRSKAKGCEVLIAKTSTLIDNEFADDITDTLNERFQFVERASDGVRTIDDGHRGALMLTKVRDVGCIPTLIEPTFANYRHKESIVIFENEDKYVAALTASIIRTVIKK